MTGMRAPVAADPASTILRTLPRHLLTDIQSDRIGSFTGALDQLGALRGQQEPAVRADLLAALLERFLGQHEARSTMRHLAALPDSALLGPTDEGAAAVGWLRLCQEVPVFDPRPGSELTLDPGVSYHMGSLIESVRDYFPSLETELIDPQVLPTALNDAGEQAGSFPPGAADPLRRAEELVYRNLGWWGCLALALVRAAARISAPPGWAAWPALVFLLTASFGGWTMTILGSAVLSGAS